MEVNNNLLVLNEGSWDAPPLNQIVWSSEQAQRRQYVLSMFNEKSNVWMFKDPRTTLLLSFWKEGFEQIGNRLLLTGTFRHPIKVSLSLYQRSQMPLQKGVQLWIHYNQKLLTLFKQSPFPLVCYDLPKEEYQAQLCKVIEYLNEKLPAEHQLSALAAQEFYSEDLVNQKEDAVFTLYEDSSDSLNHTKKASLQIEAEALYKELCVAAELPVPERDTQIQRLYLPLSDTVEAYQYAIELQPARPQLHFMLGNAQRQRNERQAAIASYRKALTLNHPQPFDVYRMLCQTLEETGEDVDAIAAYQQGIHQTAHPQLYKLLARLLTKAKQYNQAEEILQQLIELQPDVAHHKITLGNLYLQKKKDLDAAAEIFQQALSIEPDHYIAQKHLGIAYMRQNRIDDALSYLLAAQELYPQHSDIYPVLGQCYMRQERWQPAVDSYKRAITTNPQVHIGVHFSLGVARQNLKHYQLAEDAYEQVLKKSPSHPQAKQRLKQIRNLIDTLD